MCDYATNIQNSVTIIIIIEMIFANVLLNHFTMSNSNKIFFKTLKLLTNRILISLKNYKETLSWFFKKTIFNLRERKQPNIVNKKERNKNPALSGLNCLFSVLRKTVLGFS